MSIIVDKLRKGGIGRSKLRSRLERKDILKELKKEMAEPR
jgi:hypothetical protein